MLFLSAPLCAAAAEDRPPDDRIQDLERKLDEVLGVVQSLQEELAAEKAHRTQLEVRQQEESQIILEEIESLREGAAAADAGAAAWSDRMSLGGYGEIHYNDIEGDKELLDIHRLVLYTGYEFADWIRLESEVEIEHAYVTDDADGELIIEQLYVDFLLNRHANVRMGRILAPLGIVNQRHEPPSFHGVERPAFSQFIIPTTWSLDGVGLYGDLLDNLRYELYLTNSLDGSKFSATSGIRGGRMKERPGFNEPAVSGRLDFSPLSGLETGLPQDLRLGASFFYGGLDNGNNGGEPSVDGDIWIGSLDFDYTLGPLEFRGVTGYEKIDGAEELPGGVAEEIFGYYVQAAWRFWPQQFKTGLLAESDAAVFVRYDDIDTQHEMPAGRSRNPAGDRDEITVGLSFFPVPNVVLKADYQFRDDDSDNDPADQFNLGLGWQF